MLPRSMKASWTMSPLSNENKDAYEALIPWNVDVFQKLQVPNSMNAVRIGMTDTMYLQTDAKPLLVVLKVT